MSNSGSLRSTETSAPSSPKSEVSIVWLNSLFAITAMHSVMQNWGKQDLQLENTSPEELNSNYFYLHDGQCTLHSFGTPIATITWRANHAGVMVVRYYGENDSMLKEHRATIENNRAKYQKKLEETAVFYD